MVKKNSPPKGVRPPQLIGKGFDAHPENRNKSGPPKRALELRNLISEMAAEEIEVEVGRGKDKRVVKMTRMERILLEWFETQSGKKQELLFAYGFGKPVDTLEVKGELRHIVVSRKKKEEPPTDGNA